jgi:hypothetical protein
MGEQTLNDRTESRAWAEAEKYNNIKKAVRSVSDGLFYSTKEKTSFLIFPSCIFASFRAFYLTTYGNNPIYRARLTAMAS